MGDETNSKVCAGPELTSEVSVGNASQEKSEFQNKTLSSIRKENWEVGSDAPRSSVTRSRAGYDSGEEEKDEEGKEQMVDEEDGAETGADSRGASMESLISGPEPSRAAFSNAILRFSSDSLTVGGIGSSTLSFKCTTLICLSMASSRSPPVLRKHNNTTSVRDRNSDN